MRIPFNLYDFLGYTVPGLIVIIIIAILINPALLSNLPDELKDKDSGLAQFLRPTVTQGILYVIICYLVGFTTDGLVYWLFGKLASVSGSIMRFHARDGWFEKTLLDCKYRDDSEEFSPYTDEFVKKFKVKIETVFGIKVETVREEAERAKDNKRYIEIFDLCRTTVLKQSPDVYSRGFTLLAQYNSAKLMGAIFFFATFAFFIKLVGFQQCIWIFPIIVFAILWVGSKCPRLELTYGIVTGLLTLIGWFCEGLDLLFACYCVSAVLCPTFFHLYRIRLKHYRNTILYGFYAYAVAREKSEKSVDREK